MLNWLEKILYDNNLTCYRMSKLTGISEQQLHKIIKNDVKMDNVKYGQVMAILEIDKKKNTP